MPDLESQGSQFQDQSVAFQELADFAYTRAEAPVNQLGLRPFSVEGDGLVIPIASRMTSDGPFTSSQFSVMNGELTHRQEYPAMIASATLVGLWLHGNRGEGEAALYETEAAFQPAAQQKSVALAEAVLKVHGRGQAQVIDAPRLGDGTIIVNRDGVMYSLRATAETTADIVQSDEEDDALRLSLHGKMTVDSVPNFLRVNGDVIYSVTSRDEGHEAMIAPDHPVLTDSIPRQHSASHGNQIHVDQEGTIIPVHALRAFPLPRLPLQGIVEILAAPLSWEDSTQAFLAGKMDIKTVGNLKIILALPQSYTQLNSLQSEAVDALARIRQEQPFEPKIIGTPLVLAAIKAMPGDISYRSETVTIERLEGER